MKKLSRYHNYSFCLLLCHSRCFTIGTLLSVHFKGQFRFFLLVKMIISATTTAKTQYNGYFLYQIKRVKTAKPTPANMELSDTNRVKNSTKKKTATQHIATTGFVPITIPSKVATPFPPLKSAKIGKTCATTPPKPSPDIKFVRSSSLYIL